MSKEPTVWKSGLCRCSGSSPIPPEMPPLVSVGEEHPTARKGRLSTVEAGRGSRAPSGIGEKPRGRFPTCATPAEASHPGQSVGHVEASRARGAVILSLCVHTENIC